MITQVYDHLLDSVHPSRAKPARRLSEYMIDVGLDLNLLHKAQTDPVKTMREYGLDAAQIEAVLAGPQDVRERIEFEEDIKHPQRCTMMSIPDGDDDEDWLPLDKQYTASGWGGYPITKHEK